jgi:hypothetical protein
MTTPQEIQLPKVIDNSAGVQSTTEASSHAHSQVYGNGSDFRQTINDFMRKVADTASQFTPGLELFDRGHEDAFGLFPKDVTSTDRSDATKKLDGEITPMLPQDEQDALKNIHQHLIDGDPQKLAQDLQDFKKNHPDSYQVLMLELERELKLTGAGIGVALDSQGNTLLYKNDGKSAISINPDTGAVSERPISVAADGTVTLQPGEILNGDTGTLAKDIGDGAARNLTNPWLGKGDDEPLRRIGIGIGLDPDDPWGRHDKKRFDPFPADKPYFM